MRLKENIRNRLSASTLIEVLILMILSGIVFLSVMEGFGLLRRFLDRTSQRIAERTEQYAGYFHTADLAGDSDSLLAENEGRLALYRRGTVHARVVLSDSALVVYREEHGERLVTLLRVGEQTGRLPEMLAREGDVLTAELEHRLRSLGNLLEPVLILLVGLLVAVILVAMYLPMFRLGGIMG